MLGTMIPVAPMGSSPKPGFQGPDHLQTKADMAAYLQAALEDGDHSLIAAAGSKEMADIARGKGPEMGSGRGNYLMSGVKPGKSPLETRL
jgi:hypothetical protein